MTRIMNLDEKTKFATGITVTSATTKRKSEYVILEFIYQFPPSHPVARSSKENIVTVVDRIAIPKEIYDEHVKNYLKIRKMELEKSGEEIG